MLDEIANAEGVPLYAITGFMAHFRLTDEGIVELDGFGKQFGDYVRERFIPSSGNWMFRLMMLPPKRSPGSWQRSRQNALG